MIARSMPRIAGQRMRSTAPSIVSAAEEHLTTGMVTLYAAEAAGMLVAARLVNIAAGWLT